MRNPVEIIISYSYHNYFFILLETISKCAIPVDYFATLTVLLEVKTINHKPNVVFLINTEFNICIQRSDKINK